MSKFILVVLLKHVKKWVSSKNMMLDIEDNFRQGAWGQHLGRLREGDIQEERRSFSMYMSLILAFY
jgi:hypothetical protein